MTDGSSKTLAITDSVETGVIGVAIGSDGQLVAVGGPDAVCDL